MVLPLFAVVCDMLFTKLVYTEGRNGNIEVEILNIVYQRLEKKSCLFFYPSAVSRQPSVRIASTVRSYTKA